MNTQTHKEEVVMKQYESPQRTGSPCDNMDYFHNFLNDLMSHFERGEYDCVHGHAAMDGEDDKYYEGYAKAYESAENAGAQSTEWEQMQYQYAKNSGEEL